MKQPESTAMAGGVKWRWPSVHPEGRKFILISGAITAFFAFMAWETLAWPMAGITLWIAAFFRDPVRSVPRGEGLIIAPADGMVTLIQTVLPPRELAGAGGLGDAPLTRVSIFMSVFDVHINRAPIGGTIKQVVYISGKFLNADLDKASEDNERQHILVEDRDGVRIGFTQIAGLVARRIMPFVKPGDIVAAGQRVGLIRFGSRVDVYLPEGTAPRVTLGQRCVAGETVLGVLGRGEPQDAIPQ
ncbi:phosphatidylserine decarboxylase [Sphingomonas colocasiae]|uniref:phosphatidylserine decarboxylase n=1 Tax=Sphingomonas colocasiae TaxID=1848973 RepID=UPI003CCE6E13